MNKKSRELREKIISYTILTLGAVVMLVPFLWMILTSFKTYAETVKVPIQWLPSVWNLDNYREVLVKLDFVRYYGNTILVTVITTSLMLFMILMVVRKNKVGLNNGNVIFQKIRILLAPSSRADSYRDGEIPCKPASMIIAL